MPYRETERERETDRHRELRADVSPAVPVWLALRLLLLVPATLTPPPVAAVGLACESQ